MTGFKHVGLLQKKRIIASVIHVNYLSPDKDLWRYFLAEKSIYHYL